MVLGELGVPVVLAPMAGGPATAELAAAVCEAGGLGFLAAGYRSATALREDIGALRSLTSRPFAVNVFAPGSGPAPVDSYASYARRVRVWADERGLPTGEPRHDDDEYAGKIAVLAEAGVAAVSFTFGCPGVAVAERLRAAGSEVWVTVTSAEEAEQAAGVADVLVAQGAEAGGHRGSFADREDLPVLGLHELLPLVRARWSGGLVATGGIATAEAVAAALAAGADAVQAGSAFLLCPEAGTSEPHRIALQSGGETVLTRAYTGRLARGIRNAFFDAHDANAPVAYPEIHHVTAPLRRAARERGDASALNLWAGESYPLARAEPAADVVARLASAGSAATGARSPRPPG